MCVTLDENTRWLEVGRREECLTFTKESQSQGGDTDDGTYENEDEEMPDA
jgi:hypothetical protein